MARSKGKAGQESPGTAIVAPEPNALATEDVSEDEAPSPYKDALAVLTQPRRIFVSNVVQGKTLAQAVAATGQETSRPEALAEKWLARPDVAKAIGHALNEGKIPTRAAVQYGARFALARLFRIIEDPNSPPAIAASAARDWLDRAGFGAVSRSEHLTASASQVLKDLTARTVDVTPRDDDE